MLRQILLRCHIFMKIIYITLEFHSGKCQIDKCLSVYVKSFNIKTTFKGSVLKVLKRLKSQFLCYNFVNVLQSTNTVYTNNTLEKQIWRWGVICNDGTIHKSS